MIDHGFVRITLSQNRRENNKNTRKTKTHKKSGDPVSTRTKIDTY